MNTTKPTRGPASTKTIFGHIVDDLKALEKEDTRLDLEITKLKARAPASATQIVVAKNGVPTYFSAVGTLGDPVTNDG